MEAHGLFGARVLSSMQMVCIEKEAIVMTIQSGPYEDLGHLTTRVERELKVRAVLAAEVGDRVYSAMENENSRRWAIPTITARASLATEIS